MLSSIIHRSQNRPAETAPSDASGVTQKHEQWTTIEKKNPITGSLLSSIKLRSTVKNTKTTSFDPPLIRELKGRLKQIRSSVAEEQK